MSELYAKSRRYGPGVVGMIIILVGALLAYWNLIVGGSIGLVGVLITYHNGIINMNKIEAISVGLIMTSALIASVDYTVGSLFCLASVGMYIYSKKLSQNNPSQYRKHKNQS